MKLTDLDPHFITRSDAPLEYDHTNQIDKAEGLQMCCPACFWSANRRGKDTSGIHTLMLWRSSEWNFVGHDYRDLSLLSGRVAVMMTAGGCHSRFMVKRGKVDFV